MFDPSAAVIAIREEVVNALLNKWLEDLDEERGVSS